MFLFSDIYLRWFGGGGLKKFVGGSDKAPNCPWHGLWDSKHRKCLVAERNKKGFGLVLLQGKCQEAGLIGTSQALKDGLMTSQMEKWGERQLEEI